MASVKAPSRSWTGNIMRLMLEHEKAQSADLPHILPPLTPPPSMALLTGSPVMSTSQLPSDRPMLLNQRAATEPMPPVTSEAPVTPVSKYSSIFIMSTTSPKKKDEAPSQSQFAQEQELCTSPSWSEFGGGRSEKKERKKLERERKELEKKLKKELEKQQKAEKASKRLSKRPPPLKTGKSEPTITSEAQSTTTAGQLFDRRMTSAEIPSAGSLSLPEITSLGILNMSEITSPNSLKSPDITSPGSVNMSELTTPATSMESSPRLESSKPDTPASSSASSFETAPKQAVRHSCPPNLKGTRQSSPPNFSRPTPPGTTRSSRSNSSTDLSSASFETAPSVAAELPVSEEPPRHLRHTRGSTSEIGFQASSSVAASAELPTRRLRSSRSSISEVSPTLSDTQTTSQESPSRHQRSLHSSATGRANPSNRATWTVGKRSSELNNRKPVGKTFFICCHCLRWHDMPADTFEKLMKPTMIPVPSLKRDEGGSTETSPSSSISEGKKPASEMPTGGCTWCNHDMSSTCCAAWTTVVYFHTRHC